MFKQSESKQKVKVLYAFLVAEQHLSESGMYLNLCEWSHAIDFIIRAVDFMLRTGHILLLSIKKMLRVGHLSYLSIKKTLRATYL